MQAVKHCLPFQTQYLSSRSVHIKEYSLCPTGRVHTSPFSTERPEAWRQEAKEFIYTYLY